MYLFKWITSKNRIVWIIKKLQINNNYKNQKYHGLLVHADSKRALPKALLNTDAPKLLTSTYWLHSPPVSYSESARSPAWLYRWSLKPSWQPLYVLVPSEVSTTFSPQRTCPRGSAAPPPLLLLRPANRSFRARVARARRHII